METGKSSKGSTTMIGFKGFDPYLKCRGFHYEVGKEYEETCASLCSCGFHFCEAPLDVLNYYPLLNKDAKFNRFALVEVDGVTEQVDSDDSTRVARKLKVIAEIGISDLVKAAVSYIEESVKGNEATTGFRAHSATTGYRAHSATIGFCANSATTGDCSHSTTTGSHAHSVTTGYCAHSATTGFCAHSATTGDYANSATTGDYANSATTGDYANSATTGDYANSATTSKNSIAAALGIESKAQAGIGGWIVLAEWDMTDGDWCVKDIKGAKVDGEKIKPDVFYVLKDGEFIEVGSCFHE